MLLEEDVESADVATGKRLRFVPRGVWPWLAEEDRDGRLRTDTEVLSQTENQLRFTALRTSFNTPSTVQQIVDIGVDAEAFNDLGDLTTDMAFLLYATDLPGPSVNSLGGHPKAANDRHLKTGQST